jgi:hypothetical protein
VANDAVTSDAIADGAIAEADLSQALIDKINSAGEPIDAAAIVPLLIFNA